MPSFLRQSQSLGFVIIILFFIIYTSFYTVNEGQRSLLLRFGKIAVNSQDQAVIGKPGLHFKLPFIDTVRWFDLHLQMLDVDSSRVLTQDQQYLMVDYYAKWRIADLSLYYIRTGGDTEQARLLLQQKINDSLRAEFGRRSLSDVISDARAAIMTKLQTEANNSAKELGIEVIDVRIKRIDLPTEVSSPVFERMRTDRELVATKHRSDGKAAAERIQAQADADATVIEATAQADAAKVRAEGKAVAAKIYADAYNKDPEFYAFYQSLEAYRKIFNNSNKDRNILILKPDSQFFKYFNASQQKHENK